MDGQKLGAALAAAVAIVAAGEARADPRLDEKVYEPYVENHVLEAELRAGAEIGGPLDGARTWFGELEYGVNDRLSLALIGKATREPGADTKFTGAGVEAVYYLGQIPHTGVDAGLYLEYAKGLHGESDVMEGKLLFAKRVGRFEGVLNLIAERPINAPGEHFASYGYAASADWRGPHRLKLGVQAFGDLGDDHGFLKGRQGAYVGPTLGWEYRPKGAPVEIELNAGWLKAVAADRDEADSQVRFTLEVERSF